MTDPHKAAIEAYLSELIDLGEKRIVLQQRASRVEKAVRAIIDLVEGADDQMDYMERLDDIVRPVGLTNAIRAAVDAGGKTGVTPMEVRDALRSMLIGHTNALASVHTILKRLQKSGEIEPVSREGKTFYRGVSLKEKMEQELISRFMKSGDKASTLGRQMSIGQRIAEKESAYESGMRGNEKPKK